MQGDAFDHSFMVSVYAIVLQEPERIEKLFVSQGDRGYEISHYNPVDRGQERTTLSFDMTKTWDGKKATNTFKDHW